MAHEGALDRGLKIRPMVLPDRFIDHDSQSAQLRQAGLDAQAIMATALSLIDRRDVNRAVVA